MRVVWREDVEGAVESSPRECECEGEVVVVVVVFVVVDFGDLGETIGKREAEGEGGMVAAVVVVLLCVGDCGLMKDAV
jgi:hypothetical protein